VRLFAFFFGLIFLVFFVSTFPPRLSPADKSSFLETKRILPVGSFQFRAGMVENMDKGVRQQI